MVVLSEEDSFRICDQYNDPFGPVKPTDDKEAAKIIGTAMVNFNRLCESHLGMASFNAKIKPLAEIDSPTQASAEQEIKEGMHIRGLMADMYHSIDPEVAVENVSGTMVMHGREYFMSVPLFHYTLGYSIGAYVKRSESMAKIIAYPAAFLSDHITRGINDGFNLIGTTILPRYDAEQIDIYGLDPDTLEDNTALIVYIAATAVARQYLFSIPIIAESINRESAAIRNLLLNSDTVSNTIITESIKHIGVKSITVGYRDDSRTYTV